MNNDNKLMVNTSLLRKESEFRPKSCLVEKAIAVSHGEFEYLKSHPLRENDLIVEHLKTSGSYENAKEAERDRLVCDEAGFAETKLLPYGVYVVHQTKGWDNTEWIDDFEVIVSENEKDYFYLINDSVITSYVKIVKKDAETGNIIPVSGIGFMVWDCANSCYISQKINYPSEMTLDTFYTDETGTLMLPNELAYGDYELHEVQSANGYVLDETPVSFTIDGTEKTVVVEKFNTAQKGRISVQKSGEIFNSVSENNEKYTPIFEEKGLANAVFQVIAAEDIVTPDGTVCANADDVVAELVTDENGYAKNHETQTVELTYAGQEIAVRDTVNSSFNNDYQGVEISLEKFMEHRPQQTAKLCWISWFGNNGENK